MGAIGTTERRRKKVRHYDEPGDAHFLTFSCYRRMPLLSKDRSRMWLTVSNANRTYRHFWQPGPGQDRNVYHADTTHQLVEYIHGNPVRRGLVSRAEDWPWSSAADWAGRAHVLLRIDRTIPRSIQWPG